MSKKFLPFIAIIFLYCAATAALPDASPQDQLVSIIQSKASPREKWAAAHQLAAIANSEVAAKLAPMLTNEELGDLARYVLEPLPTPSADKALRNALITAKGQPLVGIITSLGVRRDPQVVLRLANFLDDTNRSVVVATLAALGKIGTVPAVKTIEVGFSTAPERLHPQYWAALIECAQTLHAKGKRAEANAVYRWLISGKTPEAIREAAVRGVILTGGSEELKLVTQYLPSSAPVVLRLAQTDLPGPEATDALILGLAKLPPAQQVLLVEALGQRTDEKVIPALIHLAWTGSTPVRLAAIRSVRHNPQLVSELVDLISDPDKEVSQAAGERLASLPEPQADAAILTLFDSKNPALRLAATQMAGHRRLAAATPALVKVAVAVEPGFADAALTALSETATATDCLAIAGLLSVPTVDADSVIQLLVTLGKKASNHESYVNQINAACAHATPPGQSALTKVLRDLDADKPSPPAPAVVAEKASVESYPFFPFCIDWHDSKKRNYTQQAAMLKELGYPGVGHIYLDGVAERLKSLDDAGLKLFQITMNVNLTPGKQAYDPRFKDVLAMVKGRHVQFDLLFNGLQPSDASVDPHAVEVLREMSDLAKDSGAQLLLYPHVGCWVETINDAVRVADKVNCPNVGVMFNLCHWLRADKQRDYQPLLARAMPKLWAVSICGADDFDPAPGWNHYIQPLDKGSFDVGLLLKTLKDLGYKGPIGLQCYGIGGDAQEHLARSLSTWQKLRLNLEVPPELPGYVDTPLLPNSSWKVHDRRRPQPGNVNPGDSDILAPPGKAPSDAIILFDGKDISQWKNGDAKGLENGCINILKTGELTTRQEFGPCQLHVEWATPARPDGDRMEWGNSGVFLLGLYELQIIESHDSHIYADGNAGAIYGQFPPLVNSSRKPGEWQTFDIVFTPPEFKGEKVLTPAYFTVLQNGVLVQNNQAVIGPTVHRALPRYDAASRISKGPIVLQCHGSAVRFRNIWIRPLPANQPSLHGAPLTSLRTRDE